MVFKKGSNWWPSSTLSANPEKYGLATGLQVYKVNTFTSDDTNCPITSYGVTTLNSGVT